MLSNINHRICVTCKHWRDPGESNLKFRPGAKLFDYNPDVKKMCLVRKIETKANFTCSKYESKFK